MAILDECLRAKNFAHRQTQVARAVLAHIQLRIAFWDLL